MLNSAEKMRGEKLVEIRKKLGLEKRTCAIQVVIKALHIQWSNRPILVNISSSCIRKNGGSIEMII